MQTNRKSDLQAPAAEAAKRYARGIESREDEFGRSVAIVMRSLQNTSHYPHEANDALVKMHLVALQFAKKHDMWDEFDDGMITIELA